MSTQSTTTETTTTQQEASSSAARPTASVVVLNYNGLRYLDTCLEALMAQEVNGGVEILLVDNHSVDGSADHVRRQFPKVRVIESDANLGFAAGNNLGIEHACGRHIVLLNNDTSVRPGWLAALIRAAEAEPDVGAVTSKLVFMDRPGVIQNAGTMLLSDGSGADRGAGEEDHGQYDRPDEVFAACGCAMLLNRRMLQEVGGFDPTFFTYYEDTDLSWRMRLRGWRIVYEPSAVVEHVHAGSSIEWSPFFTFHADRNRLFMILKNASPSFVLRALTWYGWLATQGAARALLRRKGRPGRASRRPHMRPSSRARVHLRVLASLIRHMPEMVSKRRQIRRTRVVADADIARHLYPRKRWDDR